VPVAGHYFPKTAWFRFTTLHNLMYRGGNSTRKIPVKEIARKLLLARYENFSQDHKLKHPIPLSSNSPIRAFQRNIMTRHSIRSLVSLPARYRSNYSAQQKSSFREASRQKNVSFSYTLQGCLLALVYFI
jgi:ABC-type anion transport system duplicated permease subunit